MLDARHGADLREALGRTLTLQRAAHDAAPAPTAAERIDRIDRALAILVDRRGAFEAAMNEDFGHRSPDLSALADIGPSVNALRHARKHVKRWMRPERRKTEFPLNLIGAGSRVEYQPKGVVGIMSPWNFPVAMAFCPLAGVLAAGNRAMIKPSEFTPATSALMAEAVASAFAPEEIAVATGGAELGAAFSTLPFDHIIFTGSTPVGRLVMAAAAPNLTPVTLELGGKSPAIVGASADLRLAATRIVNGKAFNAGQVCIAPDYVLIERSRIDAFAEAAKAAAQEMFPAGVAESADYTSMQADRHFERMQALVEDAKSKGARIVPLTGESDAAAAASVRKAPPTLILDPTSDMRVMEEEVFGPLLPVAPIDDVDEAIAHVNAGPRPLALYYFGADRGEERRVLSRTTSGGVSVNDTILHIAQDDLPFGGVGASGMGRYHGRDGFREVSHQKAVFRQGPFDLLKMIRPPYGKLFRLFVDSRIKK